MLVPFLQQDPKSAKGLLTPVLAALSHQIDSDTVQTHVRLSQMIVCRKVKGEAL